MIANCGVYSFLTGAIAPAYQGKGNGRQLFEELIAKCKGEVMLDVWASNVKAYNLYKRLGFRQSFERKVGDDYIITMYKI
jgi:ribosomal protein S18 acetylase RimI-like enzyme